MKKIGIIVGTILVLIIGGLLVVRTIAFPLKYKSEIQKYAKQYNLKPELIAAIIHVRTNFDPKEYKKGEACGMFAIQYKSAEVIAKQMELTDFKPEDTADPETSIKMGAFFMAQNYKNKDIAELVEKVGGISWQHAKPNTKEDEKKKFRENYYKKYFVEKIKSRARIYKLLYPTL